MPLHRLQGPRAEAGSICREEISGRQLPQPRCGVWATEYGLHNAACRVRVQKVQYTQYSVQGTVQKVQYTQYSVQGTVQKERCTRYGVQGEVAHLVDGRQDPSFGLFGECPPQLPSSA